jgi:hypothetical protein
MGRRTRSVHERYFEALGGICLYFCSATTSGVDTGLDAVFYRIVRKLVRCSSNQYSVTPASLTVTLSVSLRKLKFRVPSSYRAPQCTRRSSRRIVCDFSAQQQFGEGECNVHQSFKKQRGLQHPSSVDSLYLPSIYVMVAQLLLQ